MRSMVRTLAILTFASATAGAQGPVPPMSGQAPGGRMGGRTAEMFLARTGELGLSDAQVVRLAAIARRAESRRVAMRAAFDSARQRFAPGQTVDTAARRQFRQRMTAEAEKARDAARVDQRDALAVLTADQQARAWDMFANRGRAARGGAMRRGRMGGPDARGMRGRSMRGPGARGMRMGPPRQRGDGPEFRGRRDMLDRQ